MTNEIAEMRSQCSKNKEESKLRSQTACIGDRVARIGSAIVPNEMPMGLVEVDHIKLLGGFIQSHSNVPGTLKFALSSLVDVLEWAATKMRNVGR